MKARLIHSLKLIDADGGIEERKIKEPAVLYDNHHPKGHHKHIGGRQAAYEFSTVGNLLKDFSRDIEALK